MTIRPLQVDDDIAAITRLLHAAYAPLAVRGFRYVATHQDDETTRKRLEAGWSFLAIGPNADITGTVTLYPPDAASPCEWYQGPGHFHFGQFGVLPSAQRRGLGGRLLRTIEAKAMAEGARELALDTAEGASHLVDWYRRLGFRFIDHVDWPVTNYRSVILSKTLAPTDDSPDL